MKEIKEIKSTEYFHKLAVELKKWFDDREIDTGYTDTYVGHLAILVQEKIVKELESYINPHYIAKESTFLLLINNGTEGWSIWGKYETLDETIKSAIANSYGSEYKIVKEVNWKVSEINKAVDDLVEDNK